MYPSDSAVTVIFVFLADSSSIVIVPFTFVSPDRASYVKSLSEITSTTKLVAGFSSDTFSGVISDDTLTIFFPARPAV